MSAGFNCIAINLIIAAVSYILVLCITWGAYLSTEMQSTIWLIIIK